MPPSTYSEPAFVSSPEKYQKFKTPNTAPKEVRVPPTVSKFDIDENVLFKQNDFRSEDLELEE